jgi:hypothetical protein
MLQQQHEANFFSALAPPNAPGGLDDEEGEGVAEKLRLLAVGDQLQQMVVRLWQRPPQ